MCSSPPCTDFSQVRNTQPGLQGQEGCKLRQWCQWFSNFRQAWQRQHILLLENVVPSADLHRELDKLVGHNSFVVDAASWGVVSRPRLWWSNVLTPPPQWCSPALLVGEGTAGAGSWFLAPTCSLVRMLPSDCKSATFHADVLASRSLFPCLTTPAPTDQGRNPPNKRRRTERRETMRRWMSAPRQYPHHQYRERSLVTIQGRLTTPDAETREWLQGLPAGTTCPAGQPVSDYR